MAGKFVHWMRNKWEDINEHIVFKKLKDLQDIEYKFIPDRKVNNLQNICFFNIDFESH